MLIKNILKADIFVAESLPKSEELNKNHKLIYVLGEELNVVINKKVYALSFGEMVIIGADELSHCFVSKKKETEYILLEFEGENNFRTNIAKLSGFAISAAYELANVLRNDANDAEKIKALAEILLLYANESDEQASEINTRDAELFGKAIDLMNDNLNSAVSMEYMAESLKISISHLKRIFAKYSGMGVHEYYLNLRIIEAIKLLKNGNSVTEAADILGFNNQNYFSSAFKRVVGQSPKEFLASKPKTKRSTNKISSKKVDKKDMPSYLL